MCTILILGDLWFKPLARKLPVFHEIFVNVFSLCVQILEQYLKVGQGRSSYSFSNYFS